ncbi:MAG: hypothetical protein K0U59_07645 [Gammaproteobacteria bacterium]|nr:hypothetical protein [Gammaproteobacteria bacterium]
MPEDRVTIHPPVRGNFYDSIVVFGDSLNDNGNVGVFTNDDSEGVFPAQPAVAFLADYVGVPKANSCSGLGEAIAGAMANMLG